MPFADGSNPVQVWREYRGLTLTALARRTEVSNGRLSAIENGAAIGSAPAQALRDVDARVLS